MKPITASMEDNLYDERDDFFDATNAPDSDSDCGQAEVGVLKEDLRVALRTCSQFTGHHYYCSNYPSAPNPGLCLAGVGDVQLPLSEGDAKSIAAVASLVSGEGVRVARNIHKVETPDLIMRNPAWTRFLDEGILAAISERLGFAWSVKFVRLELSKLILFGSDSGSLVLPAQSLANGKFAKLAVFLPSHFEGGDIKITRNTDEDDMVQIKVSGTSQFRTAFIAWYNDDYTYETMPVNSGYQLVLIYHLVYTGSIYARPSPRNAVNGSDCLERVLRRWKDGEYEFLPSLPLLAFPLLRTYKPQLVKSGDEVLQDPDARTVAGLLPAAQYHRFSVCLASIVPSAQKMDQQAYTLFDIEHINEAAHQNRKLYLHEPDLPEDIVMDGQAYPERSVRTALVIFPDQDELSIALTLQGARETLERFRWKSGLYLSRTITNCQLAIAALKSLGNQDDANMNQVAPSVVQILLECAIAWKDVRLLNEVLPHTNGLPTHLLCSTFRQALYLFNPALFKDGLYDLIKRVPKLGDRLTIINAIIPTLSNDDMGLKFADGMVNTVLSSYHDGRVEDIPILVDLAAQHGLAFIHEKVISNISEWAASPLDACSFFLELAKGIHGNKDAFLSKSIGQSHPPPPAGQVIRSSIKAAIAIASNDFKLSEQDQDSGNTRASSLKYPSNVDQICEIIELCLTVDDLAPCVFLLNTIRKFMSSRTGDVKSDSTAKEFFNQTFQPLISRMKEILRNSGVDLTDEPFQAFFETALSFYLSYISQSPLESPMERVNIGCKDIENCFPCQALESFINSRWSEHRFQMDKARRTHVVQQIDVFSAVNERVPRLPSGFITYETLKHTSPHILVVKKDLWLLREEKLRTVEEFLQSYSDGKLDKSAGKRKGESRDDETMQAFEREGAKSSRLTYNPMSQVKGKGKGNMKAEVRGKSGTSVSVRRVKEED